MAGEDTNVGDLDGEDWMEDDAELQAALLASMVEVNSESVGTLRLPLALLHRFL